MLAPDATALAAVDPDCLAAASTRVNPGSRVHLDLADGRWCSGRLEFIDLRERLLTIRPERPRGAEPATYRLGEIERIQYRSHEISVPVVLLSAAAFALLAVAVIPDEEGVGPLPVPLAQDCPAPCPGPGEPGPSLTAFHAALGGILGLTVGIMVSPALPRNRTIECRGRR